MARTYHGLSIAYRERGHLERAAEYAHKALSLYSLEQDQVLVARAENELGLLLMRQGQLDAAETWFENALAHFEGGHVERSRSHILLSLAELKLLQGDLGSAGELTEQGLKLADRFDESLAQATGLELHGRVAAAAGEWRSADKYFRAALRKLDELGLNERLAATHAEYARTFEQRGDDRRASQHWRKAAELALPRLRAESTA
jgi:tetratricopeptide (TPR) repeat protein